MNPGDIAELEEVGQPRRIRRTAPSSSAIGSGACRIDKKSAARSRSARRRPSAELIEKRYRTARDIATPGASMPAETNPKRPTT